MSCLLPKFCSWFSVFLWSQPQGRGGRCCFSQFLCVHTANQNASPSANNGNHHQLCKGLVPKGRTETWAFIESKSNVNQSKHQHFWQTVVHGVFTKALNSINSVCWSFLVSVYLYVWSLRTTCFFFCFCWEKILFKRRKKNNRHSADKVPLFQVKTVVTLQLFFVGQDAWILKQFVCRMLALCLILNSPVWQQKLVSNA